MASETPRQHDPADDPDPGRRPEHDAREAELRERDAGAHEEQVGPDANLRADDTPPGEDDDRDAIQRATSTRNPSNTGRA